MNEIQNMDKKKIISPDELIRLREQINKSTDIQLEQQLNTEWLMYDEKTYSVSEKRLLSIKTNIDRQIAPKRIYQFFRYFSRIAAILAFAVLLFSVHYYYRQSTIVAASDMIINVGKGERVNVVLPDGTAVGLNSESQLRYNPADFNKKNRSIRFEGEAFFKVSHNQNKPFIVQTSEMSLEVLGTEFNFISRSPVNNIEVALIEGHLSLSANQSQSIQELFANEKAILNTKTGEFTVYKNQLLNDAISWTKGTLVFRNQPFWSIIKSLETNYGISIQLINCEKLYDDCFTGTFPLNDPDEAIQILQNSYHFEHTKKDGQIILSCP